MTAPFTTNGVFPGALPDVEPAWRRGGFRFWLGQPGRMNELPSPNPEGYTAPAGSGETEHGLASGGSAVLRFDTYTRRWTITWPRLAGRDWQVVKAFSKRAFGPDPWCFLPPEDVNRLTYVQSMCTSALAWQASDGALSVDLATAPYFDPSGVLSWATGSSTSIMATSLPGTVVTGRDCPYVSALPWSFSVWVRTTSGTASVQARLSARSLSGVETTSTSTTTTVGTAWTRLVVQVDPTAFAGAVWIVPEIITTSATTLKICCPDLRETALGDWEMGAGVPRVNLLPLGERTLDAHMNSGTTMTLVEATAGAA